MTLLVFGLSVNVMSTSHFLVILTLINGDS